MVAKVGDFRKLNNSRGGKTCESERRVTSRWKSGEDKAPRARRFLQIVFNK